MTLKGNVDGVGWGICEIEDCSSAAVADLRSVGSDSERECGWNVVGDVLN